MVLFKAYLWGGLLLFCGFVVYDTQMIIEKRRLGDKDFIAHSLDLFIDFIQIFRKILIILMKKVRTESVTMNDLGCCNISLNNLSFEFCAARPKGNIYNDMACG